MRRIVIVGCTWLFVSLLACDTGWAQATAQISGAVRDQTGAVLPGVEVTATQVETGIARTTVTNETGSYALPSLALGPYRLEASLPGFRTFAQSGIVLQVNSSPVINPVLQVGQVTEQVEVQANAELVETRNVGIGQVIENERILELPLNGRQVTDLITLAGSAVAVNQNTLGGNRGSVKISIAGGVEYGVAYTLDGAIHNNWFDNGNLPFPFPDATQEFKLETSGLTAQNGGHSGGSVSVVTKSGTNQFHGDLFEFVRNDLFNARNYFATSGSTLKRNQFGGTLGGPIVKNKVFFFGGYQGTTLRQDPANLQSFVPTAAMLAGDFTAFASPLCNGGRQITLKTPFVNNKVDPALFSKSALAIAGRLPTSNDPCGLFTFGRTANSDDSQYVGKVDYRLSDKDSLFGRLLLATYSSPIPFSFTPDNILNTTPRGADELVQMYTIGETHLFGQSTVNAFHVAVNRSAIAGKGADFFNACDVGIKIYCGGSNQKYFILSVTGGGAMSLGSGANGTNATYRTTSYQVSDDLSIVRGNHQIAFGAVVAHSRLNQNSNSQSLGSFTVNGQQTGLGQADFLLGKISAFNMGGPSQLYMRQSYVGAYGQDTWKMSPRLSLSGGVRWEPYIPYRDTKGANYNFSYDRFKQGIESTVFNNAPAGFYYNGDPGFPQPSGVNRKLWHFGPHLGLAWDVNGDGRTSVRASYALAYDYVGMKYRTNSASAPPWGNRTALTDLPGGLEDPWAAIPTGSAFPYTLNANVAFVPAGEFLTTPYDNSNPYVQSWNLSLQRQIGTWLVSANYLGNQMTHLWATKALNPAIFLGLAPCSINGVNYPVCSTTGNTNQRRRLTLERPADGYYIGGLDEYDDGGTRNYHGLRLSSAGRLLKGVDINANYTLSHCIGDFADTGSQGPGPGEGYVDPSNRHFDRGNCSSDRRHIFNLTSGAQTPQFAGATLRAIATGWRLSGIYRFSTGAPLTVTAGTDQALNGIGSQRANQILADPYLDKSGGPMSQFLNPLAFAPPALGTFGNVGRFSIRGLNNWAFDTSLTRIFQLGDNQRIEFRAEAYNVLNSFRPNDPSTAINGNTFGVVRTAQDPRIMQFALKYGF